MQTEAAEPLPHAATAYRIRRQLTGPTFACQQEGAAREADSLRVLSAAGAECYARAYVAPALRNTMIPSR